MRRGSDLLASREEHRRRVVPARGGAMRLRRSDPSAPGIRRVRRGRGFSYECDGWRVTERATLARIRDLVIPPAWRDVWICADERGHIQAVGVDAAGRRQYRYHDDWRVKRDAAKFAHLREFAAGLRALRRTVASDCGVAGCANDACWPPPYGCWTGRLPHRRRGVRQDDDVLGDATFGLATLRRDTSSARGTGSRLLPGEGGAGDRAAARGRAAGGGGAGPAAPAGPERGTAGLLGRRRLAGRAQRGHQRLPARRSGVTSRPRTSAPGTPPWPPRSPSR